MWMGSFKHESKVKVKVNFKKTWSNVHCGTFFKNLFGNMSFALLLNLNILKVMFIREDHRTAKIPIYDGSNVCEKKGGVASKYFIL